MTVFTNSAENSLKGQKKGISEIKDVGFLYTVMKNKTTILFALLKIHTFIVSSNVCNLKVTILLYQMSFRSSGEKHLSHLEVKSANP